MRRRHPVEVPRIGATAAPRGAETILVVEDYRALLQMAKRMLETAGYRVLAAGDGPQALALLERHDGPVHLLVTDVVMPGMSGHDLAARVATVHPEIKVIYTSGYPDDVVRRHGVHADAVLFLAKPYTNKDLMQAVRKALERRVEKLR